MTDPTGQHKVSAGRFRRSKERCLDFFDNHPRVGWYIAFLATLNVLLNLLELYLLHR